MKPDAAFMDQLVTAGLLTEADSKSLLEKYRGDAFSVLLHLTRGSVAPREVLGKMWGDACNVAYVDLGRTLFQTNAVTRLPQELARRYYAIPLYKVGNTLTVATAYPVDQTAISEMETAVKTNISPVFSFPDAIQDAIAIQYQSKATLGEFLNRVSENALFKGTTKITSDQLEKLAGDQSIIELGQSILLLGVKERASDIHIEPQEDLVRIRFRIDGVLQERLKIEKALLPPLVSTYKVQSSLDITERRRPQDGRISLPLKNRTIDFRLSVAPTIYGEKIVLRILGQINADEVPSLLDLDFAKRTLEGLQGVVGTPNGIFFVTGPTGSGKTTTLFSVLKQLNQPGVNIMTIEDPVEYRLPGINQVQVNRDIELSFAVALRSFLRQDPDVILIGEIRDLETAKIASQAALTGHLVLATMHTNSAPQAVTRLIEIGVEPYLVAPAIQGVLGQRLVRRICEQCKEPVPLTPAQMEKYFIFDTPTPINFYRGKGCAECNHLGYAGRVGLHELLLINDELRSMVAREMTAMEIQKRAIEAGYKTIRYDGMKKVLRGITTIEELERVTYTEEVLIQ